MMPELTELIVEGGGGVDAFGGGGAEVVLSQRPMLPGSSTWLSMSIQAGVARGLPVGAHVGVVLFALILDRVAGLAGGFGAEDQGAAGALTADGGSGEGDGAAGDGDGGAIGEDGQAV